MKLNQSATSIFVTDVGDEMGDSDVCDIVMLVIL